MEIRGIPPSVAPHNRDQAPWDNSHAEAERQPDSGAARHSSGGGPENNPAANPRRAAFPLCAAIPPEFPSGSA